MHMHSLNWLAILVAAMSTMVVGFLWYSPLLFAKPWMKEMGYDPDDKVKMEEMKKTAGPAYVGSFVAGLISAFTLALILHGFRAENLHFGLMASFHIWLGFVATVQFPPGSFEIQAPNSHTQSKGTPERYPSNLPCCSGGNRGQDVVEAGEVSRDD